MASPPSRAGALSAGIVGALLATGVVLVGGHLTHLLPGLKPTAPAARPLTHSTAQAVPTTEAALDPASTTTTILVRAPYLEQMAASLSAAMPIVTAFGTDGRSQGVGLVVGSNGLVLVPRDLVENATAVTVSIASQQFVAKVLGSDIGTGLAVLRVNPDEALKVMRFSGGQAVRPSSLVGLVWVDSDGVHASFGTVSEIDAQLAGVADPPPLLDSVRAWSAVPGFAEGAAVVDGSGVVGIVTEIEGETLITTPGWLASLVVHDVVATGKVAHGWLGIQCKSVSGGPGGEGPGVEVLSVDPGSAAFRAGLRPGDVIQAVDGQAVTTRPDVVAALYPLPPDQTVVLVVERGGRVFRDEARLAAAA
jgi:serine protease Do